MSERGSSPPPPEADNGRGIERADVDRAAERTGHEQEAPPPISENYQYNEQNGTDNQTENSSRSTEPRKVTKAREAKSRLALAEAERDASGSEEAHQDYSNARREYAKTVLESWRKGEIEGDIDKNDLALIVEDIAELGVDSALAETMLNRYGFNNVQHALRKLGIDGINVKGQEISLGEEGGLTKFWKSPDVTEQLRKLGIGSGITLAVAGTVAALGGPVAWAAIGLGIGGAAAGRAIASGIHKMRLNRKVEDGKGGEKIAFKNKVAKEMFTVIINAQNEARRLMEAGNEEGVSPESITELLTNATTANFGQTQEKLNQLNKEKRLTELALATLLGGAAVGASFLAEAGSAAEGVADVVKANQDAFDEAVRSGIRIEHIDGKAYPVLDGTAGHEVFFTPHDIAEEARDGIAEMWNARVYSEEVTDWLKGGAKDIYSVVTADNPNPIPMEEYLLQGGDIGEARHAGEISPESVKSAIERLNEDVMREALAAQEATNTGNLVSGVTVLGSTLGTELGFAKAEKNKKERIAKGDGKLLDSLDEVEKKVNRSELVRKKQELERKADQEGSKLPELGDYFVEGYRDGDRFVNTVGVTGEPMIVRVKGVDYGNNKVILEYEAFLRRGDGGGEIRTTQRKVSISDFLESHRPVSKEFKVYNPKRSEKSNEANSSEGPNPNELDGEIIEAEAVNEETEDAVSPNPESNTAEPQSDDEPKALPSSIDRSRDENNDADSAEEESEEEKVEEERMQIEEEISELIGNFYDAQNNEVDPNKFSFESVGNVAERVDDITVRYREGGVTYTATVRGETVAEAYIGMMEMTNPSDKLYVMRKINEQLSSELLDE